MHKILEKDLTHVPQTSYLFFPQSLEKRKVSMIPRSSIHTHTLSVWSAWSRQGIFELRCVSMAMKSWFSPFVWFIKLHSNFLLKYTLQATLISFTETRAYLASAPAPRRTGLHTIGLLQFPDRILNVCLYLLEIDHILLLLFNEERPRFFKGCVEGCLNPWSDVRLGKGQINLYSLIRWSISYDIIRSCLPGCVFQLGLLLHHLLSMNFHLSLF